MRKIIRPDCRRKSLVPAAIFSVSLFIVATSRTALSTCPPHGLFVSEYKAADVQYYSPPGSLIEHLFTSGVTGPTGMAYDATNAILYLSNTTKNTTFNDNEIYEIDSCGNIIQTFSNDILIGYPHGLRFDSAGKLFVATAGAMTTQSVGQSVVYFPAGSMGGTPTVYANNSDTGVSFMAPVDVAIDSQGYVWVSDTKTDTLYEFSAAHTVMNTFSVKGAYGLTFDSTLTKLFVSNQKANSMSIPPPAFYVEEFDTIHGTDKGAFIAPADIPPTVPVKNPLGIVFWSGNLYLANSGYDTIEEFNSSGAYTQTIPAKTNGTPHFLLIH